MRLAASGKWMAGAGLTFLLVAGSSWGCSDDSSESNPTTGGSGGGGGGGAVGGGGTGGEGGSAGAPATAARWLAFVDEASGERTLQVLDTQSDANAPISLGSSASRIEWAPDGRRFACNRDGVHLVDLADDDPASPLQVSSNRADEFHWIDSNNFLYLIRRTDYSGSFPEDYHEVFFVHFDGSSPTAPERLYNSQSSDFGEIDAAQASPARTRLAFISDSELYVLTPDTAGGVSQLLVENGVRFGTCIFSAPLRNCTQAIWWVDEDTLFYLASEPNQILLHRADLGPNSATVTDITTTHLPGTSTNRVAAAPQAGGIVFTAGANPVGDEAALYWLSADPGAVPLALHRTLTTGERVVYLVMRPTEDAVLFSASLDSALYELFAVPIDGSHPPTKVSAPFDDPYFVENIVWAPDGSWATYDVSTGFADALDTHTHAVVFAGDLSVVTTREIGTHPYDAYRHVNMAPDSSGAVLSLLLDGEQTRHLEWLAVSTTTQTVADPVPLGLASRGPDFAFRPVAGFRFDAGMFAYEGTNAAAPPTGPSEIRLVSFESGAPGAERAIGAGTGDDEVRWAPFPQ